MLLVTVLQKKKCYVKGMEAKAMFGFLGLNKVSKCTHEKKIRETHASTLVNKLN